MNQVIKKQWWLNLFWRIKEDIIAKKIRGVILLIVFALIWKFLGLEVGLLWLLFLIFAFYDWDNRAIGVMALVCLATCLVLLMFQQDDFAEQMAIYAYFFLVMTVVLQIIEYKRHPERFKESENEEK